MTFRAFVNPVSGVVSPRARQMLGCAAAALAIGAFAPSAFATNECGPVAGSVVCSALTNPNATGISYAAVADIDVSAPAGVVVNTTTGAANGVTIAGTAATTLSGAVAVTTSGIGSNGIVVTSTGGPVAVSAGSVSTSGANSSGIIATSSTGAVSVNAGPITVSGSGGNAIFAQGPGAVSVTSGGASAVDASAIVAHSTTNAASVHLTGGTASSLASDGIDITGATASLTTDAGTIISGGTNGAALSSTTGSTVNNAGTISGGVYAIATGGGAAVVTNTGTLNGALSLLGGGNVVNNAGTFNAVGNSYFSVGDVFNNTGFVAVGASGLVPVSASLNGLPAFNNSGTITMLNGHTGDTLTLSGDYAGSGHATLAVDIAPGTLVPADQLIIGGSATGSTHIVVALPLGSQPTFNTGTVIVQAGVGSSATAFAVAPASVNAGLVRYDVTYNPTNTAYSLIASPSDAAYNMLSYGTAERNLWNKSADAVTAHMQSRRDALWSLGGAATAGKFWVTMGGSVDNVHGSHDFGTLGQGHVTDTGYSQDYFGGQLGLDISGGMGSRGGFAMGITGGYINSRANLGNRADSIHFNAANGGAYLSFTSGNLFINGLGKYDYYWADAQSPIAGFNAKLHGNSYGARGEIGMRFGGDSVFVEPLAQISYLRSSLDAFSVAGTTVNFEHRDGLHGKAGARIGGVSTISENTRMSYYAGASYVHDFKGESAVTFANSGGIYTVSGYRMPDYGEGVAGISIASGRSVSGFMEATYSRTFKNGAGAVASLEGVGGRVGLTAKF